MGWSVTWESGQANFWQKPQDTSVLMIELASSVCGTAEVGVSRVERRLEEIHTWSRKVLQPSPKFSFYSE